jgi:hypothetical protein
MYQRIPELEFAVEGIYFTLKDLLDHADEYEKIWDAMEEFLVLAGALCKTDPKDLIYGYRLGAFLKQGNVLFSENVSIRSQLQTSAQGSRSKAPKRRIGGGIHLGYIPSIQALAARATALCSDSAHKQGSLKTLKKNLPTCLEAWRETKTRISSELTAFRTKLLSRPPNDKVAASRMGGAAVRYEVHAKSAMLPESRRLSLSAAHRRYAQSHDSYWSPLSQASQDIDTTATLESPTESGHVAHGHGTGSAVLTTGEDSKVSRLVMRFNKRCQTAYSVQSESAI